jgi:hypothetical protein
MSTEETEQLAKLRAKEIEERRGYLSNVEYALRCSPYPEDAEQFLHEFLADRLEACAGTIVLR